MFGGLPLPCRRLALSRSGDAWTAGAAASALIVTLGLGGALATAAVAQPLLVATASSQPTVGSPNTTTADPPLPRPSTTPCTVQLFSNVQFADFDPKPFTYTPPSDCPGPWAKVVLEGDFSVTAGRQFDRTAQIAIGHVNVFYGTTPEPSATVSRSWHVERDLTDYGALFTTAQSGDANIGNLVDSTYTGVIEGSASLQLYPVGRSAPAPRSADLVLPLSDAPGGAAQLENTTSTLVKTFTLPTNVEAAYLDVIAQSQSGDEFWYTCVPDDVADELFSCGGTAFRESEVTIDGHRAGVAPVYPWIFTGGIDPLLWRPIPDVQTLAFSPFRVDLTPFASMLDDGKPHQVGLSVFGANDYFLAAATLLVYLDSGSVHVTGKLTANTLAAAPHPDVAENLKTTSDTISGSVSTTASRQFTIAGYVVTSHGRVTTRLDQQIAFSNVQQFLVSATKYEQDIDQKTSVVVQTSTRAGNSVRVATRRLTYPATVNISVLTNADGSGSQTTSVDQALNGTYRVSGGSPVSDTVADHVKSVDTLLLDSSGSITGFQDRSSSQQFFARGTDIPCFSRVLTSSDGMIASVTDGRGCPASP